MTLSVTLFPAALGAEVIGVDLRQPLDAATIAEFRAAFDRHIVLCIREQELSEDDQLRAASCFGKVHVRRKPTNGRDPGGQWDTPFMLVTARCGSTTTPATIPSRTVRRFFTPCSFPPGAATPA